LIKEPSEVNFKLELWKQTETNGHLS